MLVATTSLAQSQARVTLTPEQYLTVGKSQLMQGNLSSAAEIADILLLRDSADFAALFLRMQTALAANDFAAVVEFGARAYAVAPSDEAAHASARAVARGYAEQKKDTSAQFWLRRAFQYAPGSQEKSAVAKDYAFLRQRNPLALSLRFGIAPSSNINAGSEAETFTLTIFGSTIEVPLSANARPLSGYAIKGGFDANYRISSNENGAKFIVASADHLTYAMSSSSKAAAPDVDGSDYSKSNLSLGFLWREQLLQDALPTDLRLSLSQSWSAGDLDTRSLAASVGHKWQLGKTDQVAASFRAEQTRNLDGDPPSTAKSVNASWTHTLGNEDALTFGAGTVQSLSEKALADYETRSIRASYVKTEPVLGVRLDFSFDYTERTFDRDANLSGQRNDIIRTVNINVNPVNFDVYGFQPVFRVEAWETRSNFDLYERKSASLSFDLKSSF